MTVVNPKSISGINSITMSSGSDDFLTIHSNNTTERVRVNNSGDVIIGSGVTLSPDGDVFATGVCTATSFSGDGSSLTGIAATDNVRTGILDVAGVGTFRGDVNIPDKIIHLGDTDTAIRFPSADTITAETGGNEVLRVVSDRHIVTQGLTGTSFNNDSANVKILEVTGDGTVGEYGQLSLSGNQNSSAAVGAIKFINRENSNSSSGGNANSKSLASIDCYADTSDSNAGDDCGGFIRFVTKGDGSGNAERARITSSGNLQITDGDLVISTSGHGISFAATSDGSGTDTSELLDDYEEGTWTPTLSYSSSGSATLSEALGFYVKIGRKVHVTITATASAQGSGSGNVNFGGLPYQTSSTNGTRLNGHLTYIAGFTNINSVITLYRAGAGSYMEVFMMNSIGSTDAITTVTRSNVTNNCTIRGMATYYVD